MTRSMPASHYLSRRGGPPLHVVPRDGTRLRGLYDALRRGETVFHVCAGDRRQLVDFYGMELRGFPGHRGGGGGVQLVGEWEGDVFVPLERILQEDMAALTTGAAA